MQLQKKSKIKKIIRYALSYLILFIFILFAIFPIIEVFSISLTPHASLHSERILTPVSEWTLENYRELFFNKPFVRWMINSIFVSVTVTMVGVGLASTAGYAFSRYRFKGKDAGMIALIATQMFPVTMLLLPMYLMLIKLKLFDNFLGLIIAYSATALPFCIWQMKGYYDTIPYSLEEAARIDGSTQFQTFYKIILPLAAPALVITALFSFMSAWSEYLVAAVIMTSRDLYTLPLGLKQFQSNFSTEWGLYAAGALVVAVPVMILFLALSRWLISGLTLGSVKE
jgi:arabinogalactan oligomer/maltooligosaccharide transport system permease protein